MGQPGWWASTGSTVTCARRCERPDGLGSAGIARPYRGPNCPLDTPLTYGWPGDTIGSAVRIARWRHVELCVSYKLDEQGIRNFRDTIKRAEDFSRLVKGAGGTVRELLWTVGEYDIVHVTEFPDNETGVAALLQLGSAGNIRAHTLRAFNAAERWPSSTKPAISDSMAAGAEHSPGAIGLKGMAAAAHARQPGAQDSWQGSPAHRAAGLPPGRLDETVLDRYLLFSPGFRKF